MTRKPKQPSATPVQRESPTEIARTIFTEALGAIRVEIRGIIDGSIKPTEHDPASRIAWLTRAAASVAAEERKADAERRRNRDELTKDDAVGFLRTLSGPEWAEVKREIDAKHTGRSGLA